MLPHAPLDLELVVHFLHVCRGDGRHLLVTEIPIDTVYISLVTFLRAISQIERHVLAKPLVKPCGKRHAITLAQRYALEVFLKSIHLTQDFFFIFREETFEQRQSVFHCSDY